MLLERVGDPSAFGLSTIRYPETDGVSDTRTTITVADDDAEQTPETAVGSSDGRTCERDCRLPAGSYDLLVVASGPITVSLALDGLPDRTVVIDGDDLPPLLTVQSVTAPAAHDLGDAYAQGFVVGGLVSNIGPSVAFTRARTTVESAGAGMVEVDYCITVDGECSSTRVAHTVASALGDVQTRTDMDRRMSLPAATACSTRSQSTV